MGGDLNIISIKVCSLDKDIRQLCATYKIDSNINVTVNDLGGALGYLQKIAVTLTPYLKNSLNGKIKTFGCKMICV